MYQRLIAERVNNSLLNSPVTLITGPRQAGKTTLAMRFQDSNRKYLTFDDEDTLAFAKKDPIGFVRELDTVILDEIQRVPELFLTIKRSVDTDRRYGRFLITGSANVLDMPAMGDSLVGRMQRVELLPLARVEILGNSPTFLKNLFSGNFDLDLSHLVTGSDLIHLVFAGGFPEIINKNEEERNNWSDSYIDFTTNRDVNEIDVFARLAEVPDFTELLASYSGQLLNYKEFASCIDQDKKTAKQYIKLLERLYLVKMLRPFHINIRNQLAKIPKVHFLDTGLLASVGGLNFDQLQKNRSKFGPLLETFVYTEILKLTTFSPMRLKLYHFRNKDNYEVDVVLKRRDGVVAGVEVKSSATIRPEDFTGLRNLQDTCKDQFAFGVVLYDGERVTKYGDRLAAVPISALWN